MESASTRYRKELRHPAMIEALYAEVRVLAEAVQGLVGHPVAAPEWTAVEATLAPLAAEAAAEKGARE